MSSILADQQRPYIWAQMRGGGSEPEPMSTEPEFIDPVFANKSPKLVVHRSPNKLWRSNSIFNLCSTSTLLSTRLPDFLSGYLSLLWEERAGKRNHEEQEAAHAEHLHGFARKDIYNLRGLTKLQRDRTLLTCMGQITIKTPNPKCRLYWCLIDFIDGRYSQSCWHFRPLLWTRAALTSHWFTYQTIKWKQLLLHIWRNTKTNGKQQLENPFRIGSMVTHFQLPTYEYYWTSRKLGILHQCQLSRHLIFL